MVICFEETYVPESIILSREYKSLVDEAPEIIERVNQSLEKRWQTIINVSSDHLSIYCNNYMGAIFVLISSVLFPYDKHFPFLYENCFFKCNLTSFTVSLINSGTQCLYIHLENSFVYINAE